MSTEPENHRHRMILPRGSCVDTPAESNTSVSKPRLLSSVDPGHFFNLVCGGCSTKHETPHRSPDGKTPCRSRDCARCRRLVDCRPKPPREPPERGSTSGGALDPCRPRLVPLRPGDADAEENLEGPCPRCSTTITLADSDGMIGLWD